MTTAARGGIAAHSKQEKPEKARAISTYRGFKLSQTADGEFFSSLDPDSWYSTRAAVKKSIDQYFKGRSNPKKYERCLKDVRKKGGANEYAVCAKLRKGKNPLALSSLASLPQVSEAGKKIAKFAKTGKWKNPRNPEDQSRQGYEMFHGRESGETVVVEELVHEHRHLWAIGDLVRLDVLANDGAAVELKNFEDSEGNPCILCGNEPRDIDGKQVATQMYLRGGDQAVDLQEFGIGEPYHDKEDLGEVTKIWYYTTKDHLGDQGGEATYHHKTGEERRFRIKKDFGKIRGREVPRPRLAYDVLNQTLEFIGGEYTIETEGVRN